MAIDQKQNNKSKKYWLVLEIMDLKNENDQKSE